MPKNIVELTLTFQAFHRETTLHLTYDTTYKIRRDKIGFVFQTFNLLPYLNARENVELAMKFSGKIKENKSKRAKKLLALVGLSGREEHRPQRLSQGEQQRVAIARALANNPAIIIADEPTGNLDVKNKQEIMKLLANLNINQKTTIIMVTHDNQAASRTERMLLLSNGKIAKEKEGHLLAQKTANKTKAHKTKQLKTLQTQQCTLHNQQ